MNEMDKWENKWLISVHFWLRKMLKWFWKSERIAILKKKKESRIYECIEFGIGDVEVMTSCTDNKNVLNRIVGWSTPIIDKKKKKKSPKRLIEKKKMKKVRWDLLLRKKKFSKKPVKKKKENDDDDDDREKKTYHNANGWI